MSINTNIWQFEYLYYIYPDLKTKESKEVLERMISETDFESQNAQMFRAGWEHAGVVAYNELRVLFRELGLPVD